MAAARCSLGSHKGALFRGRSGGAGWWVTAAETTYSPQQELEGLHKTQIPSPFPTMQLQVCGEAPLQPRSPTVHAESRVRELRIW